MTTKLTFSQFQDGIKAAIANQQHLFAHSMANQQSIDPQQAFAARAENADEIQARMASEAYLYANAFRPELRLYIPSRKKKTLWQKIKRML